MTSDIRKAFGLELRAARVAVGWTLAQLAEVAFDNPDRKGYVSQIEKGRRPITPLTVGKLAEALDLPDAIVRPMLADDLPETGETTEQDIKAEALLKAAEADATPDLAESLMIALAYEYADDTSPDLDSAYRGLKLALETAREMKARAALPDNTDAGMQAIRAEVQRLNEADEADAADAAIEAALAQNKAQTAALLELGIDQARLRNDAELAADRFFELIILAGPPDLFQVLRERQDQYYRIGLESGLIFEATIAVKLAYKLSGLELNESRKCAALGDLGLALHSLGLKYISNKRLLEAVDVYNNAITLCPKAPQNLNLASLYNNLANTLQHIGKRHSDGASLKRSIKYYKLALDICTQEMAPLDWAETMSNLGSAYFYLGEMNKSLETLEECVSVCKGALSEPLLGSKPVSWALAKNNLSAGLSEIGYIQNDEKLFLQALTNLREAEMKLERRLASMEWARTKYNIGKALQAIGKRNRCLSTLEMAISEYEMSLEERTERRAPMEWAQTKHNLSIVYLELYELTKSASHLVLASNCAFNSRRIYKKLDGYRWTSELDSVIQKITMLMK